MLCIVYFFLFKQKTAYEMRISDWSSDVCSSDLSPDGKLTVIDRQPTGEPIAGRSGTAKSLAYHPQSRTLYVLHAFGPNHLRSYTVAEDGKLKLRPERQSRSEEHTSELQSLMRISYAVFCLKKKKE